jgi:hypothetical protein
MKFATRKEKIKVNEVVSTILFPLLSYLKEDEVDAVQTAIAILNDVEIESNEEHEESEVDE